MAARRNRDRKLQSPGAPVSEAVARAIDKDSGAWATRQINPAVVYRSTLTGENEDDGPLVYNRTFTQATAVTNDPNTTARSPVTSPASIAGAGIADEVIFHVALDATITALDVEVWARTDVHDDGTTAGAWVWVLVERFNNVESYREYRANIGQRDCFLRLSRITGTGNGTLRATTA